MYSTVWNLRQRDSGQLDYYLGEQERYLREAGLLPDSPEDNAYFARMSREPVTPNGGSERFRRFSEEYNIESPDAASLVYEYAIDNSVNET